MEGGYVNNEVGIKQFQSWEVHTERNSGVGRQERTRRTDRFKPHLSSENKSQQVEDERLSVYDTRSDIKISLTTVFVKAID